MNEIAVRPIPKNQRYVTTILQTFPELLKTRLTALTCAEGYPVGSALVGYIRAYLTVSTVKQLKTNILSLRDILRYAAAVVHTMPSLRVDKYQLSFSDVTNYMTLHKSAYGYAHLTSADITLASYLVTSSEDDAENWLAEFDASPSSNLVSITDSLYRDAGELGLTAKSYADLVVSLVLKAPSVTETIETAFNNFLASFKNTDIYNPSSDAMTPLETYDSNSFAKSSHLMTRVRSRAKQKNASAEQSDFLSQTETTSIIDDFGDSVLMTSVMAIADLRLVDHVATLLFDESAWPSFITNRPKPDPASNLERAKGLSRLAGLLHSLLNYPHVLRSRMLMASYDSMSGFIGILPSLPSDLTQNFDKYVIPFDVLGCGQDASALLSSLTYKNSRNGASSELLGFPIELLSSVSVLSRLGSLPASIPPISALAMTNLTSITRNVTYDEIIAAVPIQRVGYVSDITAYLATSNVFQSNIRSSIAIVSSGYSDVYQKEVDEFLSGATFAPWVNLNVQPQETFGIDASASPQVNKGTLKGVDNVPFATAYLQRLRQTAEVGYFFTVRNYVSPRKRPFPQFPKYAIITDHIDRWQELIPTSWKALYPATVFNGEEIIDVDSIQTGSFELDLLLEKLSGSHIAIIKRYLENSATLKNWATVLSSSCLLFDQQGEEQVLVEGWGMPYGVAYSKLRMSNLDQPLLRIANTRFSVMFLRNIPIPTDRIMPLNNVPYPRYGMMVTGGSAVDVSAPTPSFDAYTPEVPYAYESLFYATGPSNVNGSEMSAVPSLSSHRLLYVIAKPYNHMAMLDIEVADSSIPSFTFDSRHAYRLDALALHLDPLETLPGLTTRTPQTVSLANRSELGNMLKLAPGLKVTKLGSYLGNAAGGGAQTASAEEAAINAVVADMETQMADQQMSDTRAADATVITASHGKELQDQVADAAGSDNKKHSKK